MENKKRDGAGKNFGRSFERNGEKSFRKSERSFGRTGEKRSGFEDRFGKSSGRTFGKNVDKESGKSEERRDFRDRVKKADGFKKAEGFQRNEEKSSSFSGRKLTEKKFAKDFKGEQKFQKTGEKRWNADENRERIVRTGFEKRQRLNEKLAEQKMSEKRMPERKGGFAGSEEKQEKKNIPCKIYRKCGSCRYLNLSYEEQLKKKQRQVEDLLGKFGRVNPIIGMDEPYYYRNKVHAVFGRDGRGNVICGTYEADSHHVVSVENCLLEDKKAQEIIHTIRDLCKSFKIKTYDEDTDYGLLRHVLIRRGFKSGEIMVILVLASPILPSKNNFVKAIRKVHPEITSVVINVNDKQTSMVLGDREIPLYGPAFIKDTLCDTKFRISAKSFYQVNPVQTEVLYNTAMDYAELTGTERVLDAYCGIGTISLVAAKHAAEVIGVELNGDAVKDARLNAKENEIKNASFYQGDAGEFLVNLAEEGEKLDTVFMDPPRSGSTKEFIEAVVTCAPQKVVYVSCNPETLARDLSVFSKKGYKVRKIQPVDMFPWTEHVETVVLLSKGEVDSKKIRVEFSLEDMDMSEFQDGATYPQIKEYVLEHTGLKVSNLYISQIKRKCGIEVGKNYNLPKSEDSRQPQCPPEKEKAIREAFKYFGMI